MLALATFFWGSNYLVGTIAIQYTPAFTLTYYRWLLACVPLVVLAQVLERPDWRAVWRNLPLLAALAICGISVYSSLMYLSLVYTTPMNAALINAVNPSLIVLAASFFLRERLTPIGIVGIALGLVGVAVVLTHGNLMAILHHRYNVGDLMMLGCVCFWTVYTLIARRLHGVRPITSTAVQSVLAVISLTPIALYFDNYTLSLEPTAITCIVYVVLGPTIASYLLWNIALTRIPASQGAVFMNLIPIYAAILSTMLGKPVTMAQICGGLLVIAGVLLSSQSSHRVEKSIGKAATS